MGYSSIFESLHNSVPRSSPLPTPQEVRSTTNLEQAALGDKSGANTSAFLNGYRMLFHNRENSDTYGELV
ncbi:hypothetical protein GGP41_005476 [Bipolaris sorokiniana]|uniref:Uncharacterized protein n=1 Tax=Cochliobolus sativus TaxID=45130 RepID=A0A8H5ZLQ5_COCSA|nr:hypothetical protein GGP41_005476 [Bipolaris sorokiniana]